MSQENTGAVNPAENLALLNKALETLNRIILDKDRQLRLAVACLLARGHLFLLAA